MMAHSFVVRWNMLNPSSGWISNENRKFLRKFVTRRRHRPEGGLVLGVSHPVLCVFVVLWAQGRGGGDVMNGIIGGQQGWALPSAACRC